MAGKRHRQQGDRDIHHFNGSKHIFNSVGGITKTSATATVNIANPGDAQNTVNLRYSVDGEDSWTDHTKTETGSTVSFPLSSLTAGTTYEVEAWLGSDTDNKVTETFTTSMAPSISSIDVGGITKTSATATVNIANPGDAQNTVNLRYSVDGETTAGQITRRLKRAAP